MHNAWHQWVESGRVDGQDMMRWFARIARDNARTPMQWNAEKNAGFTTGTPWLPVTGNYPIINAEREVNDPDSVYHYYRKLIALRHSHDVIVYGEFVPLLEEEPDVYAYARVLDNERMTVLLNWTERTVPCPLPEDALGEELISNYPTHQAGRNRWQENSPCHRCRQGQGRGKSSPTHDYKRGAESSDTQDVRGCWT